MAHRKFQPSLLEEAFAGAVSGLIATVPMTITMLVSQRLLPRNQQSTLEPRRVSNDMLRKASLHDDLSTKNKEHFSVVAHFGYGAATGMAYALAERLLPLPRGLRGPTYGLLVWAVSYAGWLPAAGTLPPPQRRPMGRNLLLIAAHFVWGATLELASTALMRRGLLHSTARRA